MTTASTVSVSELHKRSRHSLSNGADREPATKKAARARAATVVQKTTEKTAEATVTSISKMKLQTSEALDEITNQLTARIAEFKEIEEAILAQQAKLHELHDIEIEANSLQALLLAQDEERKRFSDEMAAIRFEWSEATKAHQKADTEFKNELAKSRKWEAEQFSYETTKKRKLEDDQIAASRQEHSRHFESVMTTRSNELETRATALAASESELTQLRAQVAGFEAEKEAAVKKAEAIVGSSMKRNYEHSEALAKMKADNEQSLQASKIVDLTKQVESLTALNRELDRKANDAVSKVQTIAERAIDGARPTIVTGSGSSETQELGRKR
jgi:chromosome segregation ATPase